MNCYIILNLAYDATDEEIKKSFQKMAMSYHPDRHNGSLKYQEKFKQINYAYQILSNKDKKKEHDIIYSNNQFKSDNKMNSSINNTNNVGIMMLTKPYDSSINVFNGDLKEVFEIIKNDTPRVLKQLLGLQPKINLEGHYYQKYTPLMEAVFLEKEEMVKCICNIIKEKNTKNGLVSYKYKQYINQINTEGKTALILATFSNNTPHIMNFLIKEGANIDVRDREGKNIFDYAPYSITEDMENFIMSLKK